MSSAPDTDTLPESDATFDTASKEDRKHPHIETSLTNLTDKKDPSLASNPSVERKDDRPLSKWDLFISKYLIRQVALFFLTMSVFAQSGMVSGIVSSCLETLEKTYDLTATQSGYLTSTYDIAVVLTLLIHGYLGDKVHIPIWLGGHFVVLALGNAIFGLVGLLSLENSTSYGVLIFGTLLTGLGAAPTYIVIPLYLAANVSKAAYPVYIGIIYIAANLAPGIAFLIESSAIAHGRWWVGPFLFAAIQLAFAIPLFFVPRNYPRNWDISSDKVDGYEEANEAIEETPNFTLTQFKDSVVSLSKNIPYIFLIWALPPLHFFIGISTAFVPKFVIYNFDVANSKAQMAVGGVAIGATVAGTIAGLLYVRLAKLTTLRTADVAMYCTAIAAIAAPVFYIPNFIGFIVAVAILMSVAFISTVPLQSMVIRYVENHKDRGVALSVQQILWRLLGAIPGPIVFGSVLDSLCTDWGNGCNAYSQPGFTTAYFASTFVLLSLMALMLLGSRMAWKRVVSAKKSSVEIIEGAAKDVEMSSTTKADPLSSKESAASASGSESP